MKSKITLFRFDLIRILAMVFVIGTHFNETFGSMGIRASCLHVYMGKGLLYSQMGVVLFILMSGSLSAASLERSLSDKVCSKWAQYSFAVYMIHKIVIDQVLSPFAGYGVDGRGYIRLMVYAGVLMIALGIVLYSAEKHMIQKITACL